MAQYKLSVLLFLSSSPWCHCDGNAVHMWGEHRQTWPVWSLSTESLLCICYWDTFCNMHCSLNQASSAVGYDLKKKKKKTLGIHNACQTAVCQFHNGILSLTKQNQPHKEKNLKHKEGSSSLCLLGCDSNNLTCLWWKTALSVPLHESKLTQTKYRHTRPFIFLYFLCLVLDAGYEFDICYTSVLKRAIRTLWFVLESIDQMWLPVHRTWRLNERHYGGLTGLNKAETAAKHGEAQVKIWRRSFDIPPPTMDEGHDFYETISKVTSEEMANVYYSMCPHWH